MTLIHRFSRLLSADLNALVDRLEDPQALLQQALRDMSALLDADRDHYRGLGQRLEQSARTRADLNTRMDALRLELDLCLNADDRRLARDVVKRKLACQYAIAQHSSRHRELEAAHKSLGATIAEHEQSLAALVAQAELVSPIAPDREVDLRTTSTPNDRVSEAEIDIALLAELQARGQTS